MSLRCRIGWHDSLLVWIHRPAGIHSHFSKKKLYWCNRCNILFLYSPHSGNEWLTKTTAQEILKEIDEGFKNQTIPREYIGKVRKTRSILGDFVKKEGG